MGIKIGIVGAGGNTRLRHIPGFRAIDDVEIVGVVNRTRESSEKSAQEFSIPEVFNHWQDMIDSPDIDAVCIGTWPYMHCDITIAALSANKHVLTEARMAMNLAESRRMLEAANASDRVAMIVPAPFYFTYEPTLLDMVQEGEFGDLLEIQVSALGGGYDPDTPLTWRQRRDYSGHNIMSMGIFNETIRRYAGHEKTVFAYGKTFVSERFNSETNSTAKTDIPDSLGIIAEHHSGAMAVYHFSNVTKGGRNSTIEMYGTRGGFRLENDKAFLVEKGGSLQELVVPENKTYTWNVEQEFIDSIQSGVPVTRTSFEEGVRYMEFTEAVTISMMESRPVNLADL